MNLDQTRAVFLIGIGIALLSALRFTDQLSDPLASAVVSGVSVVGGLSCLVIGIRRLITSLK